VQVWSGVASGGLGGLGLGGWSSACRRRREVGNPVGGLGTTCSGGREGREASVRCQLGTASCSTSTMVAGKGQVLAQKVKRSTVARASPSEGEPEAGDSYVPYPFDKDEYIEVAMQLLHPQRVAGEVQQATLILYSREGNFLDMVKDQTGEGEIDLPEGASEDENMAILSKIKDEKCLVVEIGGDTVSNISATLESTKFSRPLALDLLWQILERGQAISNSDWALVRVAIVDLRGGTFIGRLFFGDRDVGKIYWDCDCRPSDGVWLALQSKCPVYVSKSVWDLAAVPLSKLVAMSDDQDLEGNAQQMFFSDEDAIELEGDAEMPHLGLKHEDPEPIKRLKRELKVALTEEDYKDAVRIRDHPFMILYNKIEKHREEGNIEDAEILSEELRRAIAESGEPDIE